MLIIALEGIDGAGKTYLARRLVAALKQRYPDRYVASWAFPTPQGRKHVKEAISLGYPPAAIQLLYAADKLPALADAEEFPDGFVIYDRYILSGVAYGMAQGLDPQWLFAIHEPLPKPDLNVWLQFPPELAKKGGTDLFETADMQQRVHEAYGQLADAGCFDLVVPRANALEAILETIEMLVNHKEGTCFD